MADSQPGGVEKSSPRRWKRRLVVFVCVAVFCLVLRQSWPNIATATGAWLNVGQPLTEPVDLVYVLGGGAHLRPLVAAEIYKAGYARNILVAAPELLPDSLENSLTEAELISRMLESEGISRTVMQQLPLTATSTRGEILALKTYLEDHPDKRVAIVTDHYHTRRVRLLTRQVLPAETAAKLVFVACPTDGYDQQNWWKHETGLRTYFLELIKLLVATVRA